jgi:hypothetical protein
MDQRVRQIADTRAAVKGGRARPVVARQVPVGDGRPDDPKGGTLTRQLAREKDKGGKGEQ